MPGLPARKKQPDFLLLLSVIGLLLLGIIMVFSASQYMAANSDINDGLYYLKKQCLWAVLGLAALVLSFFEEIGFAWIDRCGHLSHFGKSWRRCFLSGS